MIAKRTAGPRCPASVLGAFALSVLVVSCSAGDPEVVVVRLIDLFPEARVEGTVALDTTSEPIEWSWDGSATVDVVEDAGETLGWNAINGIEGLAVTDGVLSGTTTNDTSILAVQLPEGLFPEDRLHAIEIRMAVSAGTQLGVELTSEEEPDWEEVIEAAGRSSIRPLFTGLAPGDSAENYTLTTADASFAPTFSLGGTTYLMLYPTDVAGASFSLESVRVVSRKAHLETIDSGPGWQGLGEIYRETIVARSPQRISFDTRLPSRPWLDLDIGTIEDGPVTFRVWHEDGGDDPLLERTLTRAGRWESVRLDLAELGGTATTLTLELEADRPGTIGYWGTVTIRQAGSPPPVTASASAGRSALVADTTAPPQGVIIVLADTLRADHLQHYGYGRETSPFLAQMAAEGASFTDTIAQGSWTKVSVPSILTSLYASTHGLVDMPDRLPASVTTLTEVYREAGYATFHTSSVPFSGKLTNLQQGVDVLHEYMSLSDVERESKSARTFTDRLLPWIERHQDVPFFVFLHIFDPHSPFQPYAPYETMWAAPEDRGRHMELTEAVKEHMDEPDTALFFPPRRSQLEAAGVDPDEYTTTQRDWYDGSIRAMDAEIERLVERLRELDLDQRTLIAFVADHGEEFLEHGRAFHGQSTYGELINVPMALWWPGAIPATEVAATVQAIDLFPTLLELSRLPIPEQVQGQSLLPLLAAQDPETLGWQARPAFSERAIEPSNKDPEPDDRNSYAIIDGGWKLIHNVTREEGWPEYELFDHVDDPLNLHNVAGDNPEVVQRLAQKLDEWLEMALAAKIDPDESLEGLSPEELSRLRALGYIR